MVKLNILREFLLSKKKINTSTYVWNTTSGLLDAFQSVIILMVIARTNGLYDAGVFSISYAIASLTVTVGKYGMRSFQVTDVLMKYSFEQYFSSRVFTCICMLLMSICYGVYGVVFNDYSNEKFFAVILVCTLKIIDSIEDVFHGDFQRRGRLDVAAKGLSIRFACGIAACSISLAITHNLIISLIVWIIVAVICFFVFTISISSTFVDVRLSFEYKKVQNILVACFALCVGSFLTIYIGNAPKYAIDSYMSEDAQACYNFLFMPVFVIGLFSNFIFQPVLHKLAEFWGKKELKSFWQIIIKQVFFIIGLTVAAEICAFWFGIPALSLLFNSNLVLYRFELCILMIGGGLLALSTLLSMIMVVIRHQKSFLLGYLLVAIIGKLFAGIFVSNFGLKGASCFYVLLVLLLVVYQIILFTIHAARDIKKMYKW